MVAVLFCCPGTIDIAAAYLKARKEAENISIFDENSRRIAVIGGDEREQVAAARLAAAGYRVYCYGRPQTALAAGVRYAATAAEALEHAGALILPQIPLLNERIYNAEGAELVLSAEEWHLAAGALLLTGRETPYLRQLAAEHRLRIAAVAADARLLQLSSRATAEAALAITVRQHPGMVQGSRVLVLGCGALGLEELIGIPARQLSLGQRMRCEIAASLLHEPGILFLDEPTIGLDAASKIAVREFIRRINRERGTTVILTTHDMQDIEALTERILLIGKGRILLDGSLAELKRRSSPIRTLTMEYGAGSLDASLSDGITVRQQMDGHAVLEVNTETVSVSDAIGRLSRHLEIRDISVSGVSAEEMVVSLYEEFGI